MSAVLLEIVLAVTAILMPRNNNHRADEGVLTGSTSKTIISTGNVDADQTGWHCAGFVARARPGVMWRLAGRIDLPARQRSEADPNSPQPLAHK
jgi:hypothetical protein